jgi:hypothetical protein
MENDGIMEKMMEWQLQAVSSWSSASTGTGTTVLPVVLLHLPVPVLLLLPGVQTADCMNCLVYSSIFSFFGSGELRTSEFGLGSFNFVGIWEQQELGDLGVGTCRLMRCTGS